MKAKVTAIVLAAGKGSRMNSDVPKQYLTLLGKPVLFYSLQAFEKSDVDDVGSLIAPRVMLCAAHQALTTLRILAGEFV